MTTQKLNTWKFAAKFAYKQNNISKTDPEYKVKMKHFGKWTCNELVLLGPTYIKLGQTLSTRQDVFPTEFTKELELLQDDVEPIDSQVVLDVIDNEIGLDKFLSVSSMPYKAASLGQVHKAKLPSGKSVVIKVKRPGISDMIQNDTSNIAEILNVISLTGVAPEGASTKQILKDATKYVVEETDYKNEVVNALKMRKIFKDTNSVVIPRVYTKLCTENIIVMEFVDSIKITNIDKLKAKNANLNKICNALLVSFLIQFKDFGFFHGDPHPGNVAISTEGKLVFFDFGLVIQLPLEIFNSVDEILMCIIQRDIKQLVSIMIKLKLIIPTTDESEIVTFLEALLIYFEKFDRKQLNSTILSNEINETLVKDRPFIFPPEFLFLGKSILLIDGICRKLDPSFNFINSATEILQKDLVEAIDFQKLAMTAFEMPTRIKSINNTINALEKGNNQLKTNMKRTQKDIRTSQIGSLSLLLSLQNIYNHNTLDWSILLVIASLIYLYNFQKK